MIKFIKNDLRGVIIQTLGTRSHVPAWECSRRRSSVPERWSVQDWVPTETVGTRRGLNSYVGRVGRDSSLKWVILYAVITLIYVGF